MNTTTNRAALRDGQTSNGDAQSWKKNTTLNGTEGTAQMTRKESDRRLQMTLSLIGQGMTRDDCEALRRVSLTLHRWHELECGIDNGGIERDEETGRVFWHNATTGRRWPFPDRETGARNRLARVMARYPHLSAYIQGDPRGCALYILRPGDVPEGKDINAYYSRGIAIS